MNRIQGKDGHSDEEDPAQRGRAKVKIETNPVYEVRFGILLIWRLGK